MEDREEEEKEEGIPITPTIPIPLQKPRRKSRPSRSLKRKVGEREGAKGTGGSGSEDDCAEGRKDSACLVPSRSSHDAGIVAMHPSSSSTFPTSAPFLAPQPRRRSWISVQWVRLYQLDSFLISLIPTLSTHTSNSDLRSLPSPPSIWR